MSKQHIDVLEERKWQLENSFGWSSFRDGLVAQKIAEIEKQIAAARVLSAAHGSKS